MIIKRDYNDTIYSKKNRLLGNCFTIIENNEKFYYEFQINKNEAKIVSSNLVFIEHAIKEFRKYNKNINVFYNESRSYYRAFDKEYTFKLPIKCIQPSKFFINEEKLNIIEEYIDEDDICVPVCIIDDEYVLLDGHTRLYLMNQNYRKLVDVYIDEKYPQIEDFIYMAKENNIRSISQMKLLSNEEYHNIWDNFINEYYKANFRQDKE